MVMEAQTTAGYHQSEPQAQVVADYAKAGEVEVEQPRAEAMLAAQVIQQNAGLFVNEVAKRAMTTTGVSTMKKQRSECGDRWRHMS